MTYAKFRSACLGLSIVSLSIAVPVTAKADMSLRFSGSTPYLTASCMKGNDVALNGIENINGQLRWNPGAESSFGSTCLDARVEETGNDVILRASCMTQSGSMNDASLPLSTTMVLDEVASYPDC